MAQQTLIGSLSRSVSGLAGLALISLLGAGCVGQKDYVALQMQNANLNDQLADAEARAAGATRHAEALKIQFSNIDAGEKAAEAQLVNYERQIAELNGEKNELMNKYEAMLQKIGTGPALPPELTNELTVFATNNSDLVTFDPKQGIVKFKSDVTFQSGDAELTPDARAVIERFAGILNAPVASQYELRIAGHTDNVNAFSAATKQKGHKDNWYLSSHRAISVSQQLTGKGVDPSRIGVTGFADQRPVASNNSEKGRAQNRRVEVLILPTVASQREAVPTEDPETAASAQTSEPLDDGAEEMLK